MTGIPRDQIVARLRQQVSTGTPIVGCGAGTGISAKLAEAGGADLIIIYNSGRYRMAGRGSLAGMMPYGDANGIVVEPGGESLLVAETGAYRIQRYWLKGDRAGQTEVFAENLPGFPDNIASGV